MEWINLHTSVLDSPEFLGEEPVNQATWLKLLRFCAGQENGGVIRRCREWRDRKWQQLARVTKREVESVSELWEWDGDDLSVAYYPAEKESVVKVKRAIAQANGAKGGRPKKNRSETEMETNPETDIGTNMGFQSETDEEIFEKAERKGREGKGKISTTSPGNGTPPGDDPDTPGRPAATGGGGLKNLAMPFPGLPETTATTQALLSDAMRRINACNPSWERRPNWTGAEMRSLFDNLRFIADMTDRDWSLLAFYLSCEIPRDLRPSGGEFWQPDHRRALVENISGVMSNADLLFRAATHRKWALPPELATP